MGAGNGHGPRLVRRRPRRSLGHHRRRPGVRWPQAAQRDQGHAADGGDAPGNPPHPQTQSLDPGTQRARGTHDE